MQLTPGGRASTSHSDRAPPLAPELAEARPLVPPPRRRLHAVSRLLAIALSIVGIVITFVAALTAGTVLHVGLAPARRITAAAVNELLAGTFRGKVTITHLGVLGPSSVDGVSATIATHDGARVLLAEGVHARIALGPLLTSLIFGGPLRIHVTDIAVDHVDALLELGPDGQLTIVDAFLPALEGPPPPPTKPSAGIDLALPRIAIRDAWVHGAIGSAPPIDASVERLSGALALTPEKLSMSAGFVGHARKIAEEGVIDLDVHGGIDANVIDAVVRATTGKASVDLHAHATIPSDADPTTNATVTVSARDVDAHAFGGPLSSLDVDTSAGARIDEHGAVRGTYDVHVLPGTMAAQPTPDAHIGGTFTDQHVIGAAHVAEGGAPIDLHYDVALAAAGGPDVAFGLTTRTRDLRKIAQLGGALEGRALVQAQGHALLGAKTLMANVETEVDDLVIGGIRIDHATADAVVQGPLASPRAALLLAASRLHAGPLTFPTISASIAGSMDGLDVSAKLDGQDGRLVKARAQVVMNDGVDVRDATITLSRAKDTVTAKVARLRSRNGRLDVEGMRIDGAGDTITGEAHLAPGSIAARVKTTGFEVGTIGRLVEGDGSRRGGRVALDVDLTATPHATKGHATIDATGMSDGKLVQSVNAKLAATFDGRALDAHVDVRDVSKTADAKKSGLGHLKVDSDGVKLAGGALDPRAWRSATGTVHVDFDTNLAKATRALPIDLPIEEASGHVSAKIDLTRNDPRHRPSVALALTTRQLAFTLRPGTAPNDDGTVTVVAKPFHSENLDANVAAKIDGETGATEVNAQVFDPLGPLLTLVASATLPVTSLFNGDAQEALLATAMKVHAEVPLRSIPSLPPMLGTYPIRGSVAVTLDATGDAKAPHIDGEIQARNVVNADDPTPIPISFDAKLAYDGAAGRVTIAANRPNGRVMDAKATVNVRVADVLAGTAPLPWNASADVTLTELPVGALAGFANQEIDGNASGTIALHDLRKAGALDAKLTFDHVVLSGAAFPRATASVQATDGAIAVAARIDQTDGFADVRASAAMKWGDAIAPSLDETKPVEVKLVAKNFRAIAAAPFLQDVFDELDGIVNANASLHIKPGFKDGAMDGAILIDKGLFETPMIGEQFSDLRARITMKPWGTWNVEELSARGTSGRFTATAQARMNGFHVQSAEAHLRIAEREKLPLAMQGTALGTAWGQIDAKGAMTPDGKRLDIDVNVPSFHVDLEDATGHAVQSTDPDTTVVVGVHDKSGKMVRLAFDGSKPLASPKPTRATSSAPPLTIHVVTHLGPDLEIRRGTMLKVYVSKGPVIDVGSETKISGLLDVPRGYIELQGKRFQVEGSTVTFNGQTPDNPVVQATAVYESPDGTRVIAKFVGPVKTGKLTLTSDPQLSQNEILSLLMFGSANGTFGQSAPQGQQGNDETQAASIAGGVATQGLNKAISGVSGVDVQTAVDTQETGNPRPEVEVALSRKVSATVLYSLGVPPPGESPDDTLLLLDWRFHRNFSTEATLGDKGTTILDLAWKYRY